MKEEVRRLMAKVKEANLEVEESETAELMKVFDENAPKCSGPLAEEQEEEVRLAGGGGLSSEQLKLACSVCFSSHKVEDDEREEACMKCTGPLGRADFQDEGAGAGAGAGAELDPTLSASQVKAAEESEKRKGGSSKLRSPPSLQSSEFNKLRDEIQNLLSKLAEVE
eukprot:751834-Hanusia_phi.AAC.1